jgi:hypothetical protein
MTKPRNAQQRRRFIESTMWERDVTESTAEDLLLIDECARRFPAEGLDPLDRDRLLELLCDDAVVSPACFDAAFTGEELWRHLAETAPPPYDVGPATLLAGALDARCASDEALAVLDRVLRPREQRVWSLELGVSLHSDAGHAGRAWDLLGSLGVNRRNPRYSSLSCAAHCFDDEERCPASQLLGAARARWLWDRSRNWLRIPWADTKGGEDGNELVKAEGGPLVRFVEEYGQGRGAGPMSQGMFGYLRARWRLLSETERDLLMAWLGTRIADYTVRKATDPDGVLRRAGTDYVVGWDDIEWPPRYAEGESVRGWVLPTAVEGEHLFVPWNWPPAARLAEHEARRGEV